MSTEDLQNQKKVKIVQSFIKVINTIYNKGIMQDYSAELYSKELIHDAGITYQYTMHGELKLN